HYTMRKLINFIKVFIPKPIKLLLKSIKHYLYYQVKTVFLFNISKRSHYIKIKEAKKKKQINVIFLVIHHSMWKVEPIFKEMLTDPYFQPKILVCPDIIYNDKYYDDLHKSYSYFHKKGYPVIKSLREDNSWVTLKELNPDIVFFTSPYEITRKEYHQNAYLNYLTCYVPYYYMATNHAGDNSKVLNTHFLNCMWKIFWPHNYISDEFSKHSFNHGSNSLVTGYPATETLLYNSVDTFSSTTWKKQTVEKKKLVYAPHHTITGNENSLSTFLEFSEKIKELAIKYQDNIQWSFKPHPFLKAKLYKHPDWGYDKTQNYYHFWESQSYTQLDNGEYDSLFLESDGIIHDCSSFIVEYMFTQKPRLFILNSNENVFLLLNDFGEKIIQGYQFARNELDMENFITDLIACNTSYTNKNTYFNDYLQKYYTDTLPSRAIISAIKSSLSHHSY
ncbi:CDP-glycerol glycerophosphotransferase family protein, partial [Providencia rettgeri]|uniref:CDP-glycerol glycerophosphotransferase family protein n=2 Tax=Morganellaceae TaxID=1903414 RepID=UPI001EFDE31A